MENMRSPTHIVIGWLLLLLLVCTAAAQEKRPKTHVFLFDVSGSMKSGHRYETMREWLVGPLLKSGAFDPDDKVVVRWFSQKPAGAPLDPNDQDLKVRNETFAEQAVRNSVPRPEDAVKDNTDIPQALDLVLSDINERYKIQGDVLIWIVTDNNQDRAGRADAKGSDITPFYEKINERKGRLFRAAYLFPLVMEGGRTVLDKENAMIMYLLHYSAAGRQPEIRPEELDRFARGAAKNIGNPVIAWFISESSFVPSFEGVSDDDVNFDQGSGVIEIKQPLPEGEEATREFRFKLKSLARQREVTGKIAKEKLLVGLPDALAETAAAEQPEQPEQPDAPPPESPAADGAQPEPVSLSAWIATVRPKDLSLKPDETSKEFTASVTAPPLRPSGFGGFWSAVISSTSEPFDGQLQFELSDLQAELQQDDSPLFHVNNTEYIKDIVRKSVDKPRPFSYNVQFVAGYNSGWRRVVVGSGFVLVLVFGAALIAGSRSRTRYELGTPEGERELALPLVGSEYVMVNGDRAAVISRRFGKLTVAPVGGYTLDGGAGARPLGDGGEEFVLGRQDDGRSYRYTLRRLNRPSAVNVGGDDFMD